MTNEQNTNEKSWIRAWKSADKELAVVKANELRNLDATSAIENLEDAYESAIFQNAPRAISGLIEMQRLFAKARIS